MVELPRQKVVLISTGKVREAVVTGNGAVWWPEHLRKDGLPPLNRYPDGWMVDGSHCSLSSFAVYKFEREIEADVFRQRLAQLRAHITATEASLLGLYLESGESQGGTV